MGKVTGGSAMRSRLLVFFDDRGGIFFFEGKGCSAPLRGSLLAAAPKVTKRSA